MWNLLPRDELGLERLAVFLTCWTQAELSWGLVEEGVLASATASWNSAFATWKVELQYMSFRITTMKKRTRDFWNQTLLYFEISIRECGPV